MDGNIFYCISVCNYCKLINSSNATNRTLTRELHLHSVSTPSYFEHARSNTFAQNSSEPFAAKSIRLLYSFRPKAAGNHKLGLVQQTV